MTPLSICIIAKNEEKKIRKCLRALAPLQGEIVLVDTGSTDKTIDVAREYTDKIFEFAWCDDFSAARNYAASKATHNLILAVDCDEYLTEADIPALMEAAKKSLSGIGMIERISTYPANGGAQTMRERIGRLYDRRNFRYYGAIHESLSQLYAGRTAQTHDTVEAADTASFIYYEVPLVFVHDGYEDEDVRREKAARDLKLLQASLEKDGPDPYVYYQIGKCYVAMHDPALAARYFDKGLSMDVNPNLTYVQEMVESYGYALLELKQYEKALQFEHIYEQFAKRADFCFLMGLIYMNNARFAEAVAEFEKATSFQRYAVEGVNSYSAWYNIGVVYECLGQTAKAREYYEKCGRYEPAKARLNALL